MNDWEKHYSDWQYEVANGDTLLGLDDWIEVYGSQRD